MFEWLKKASRVLPVVLQSIWGTKEILPPSDQTEFLEQYSKDPWIYAAVWLLATCAGKTPFWIRKGDGTVSRDHPLLTLLNQPNEDQSAFDFWEATFTYLELGGETFWEIVTDKLKHPTELYALRPDRVSPLASDDRRKIAGYEYVLGAEKIEFNKDEIVHVKYFHPTDDFRGHSSIEAMKEALVEAAYGWRFASKFMKRDGATTGYLKSEMKPGQFVKKRLAEQWGTREDENRNKTPLLPPGIAYEDMGVPPKEGGLIDLLKMLREKKIAPLGVPPVLLGLVETAKYANYDLQLRAYHKLTMEPKLIKVEGAVNRGLLPRYYENGDTGGDLFEFDKRLAGFIDIESFVKVLSDLFDRAGLTPNDLIKLTGLGEPYEDGGDEHYLGERKHSARDSESRPTPPGGGIEEEQEDGLSDEVATLRRKIDSLPK